MPLLLFYDTETTGFPLFKEPSDHPDQPHIVQLAAALVDTITRQIVASIDLIVKPDGWEIPSRVAAIHGITTEFAAEVGMPEKLAVAALMGLWSARIRVAHNEQFDARIIRIAQHRFGYSENQIEQWKSGKSECTLNLATPILQLPPTEKMIAAGVNKHKPANLTEAYRHFHGHDFENSHSAMADVRACIAVYFAIKDGVHK